MTDVYLMEPPYGPAVAGRGLRIVRQVESKDNASGWGGKDISSRWTYQLRAWLETAPGTLVIDDTIAASSTDAATGWLDDYVEVGASTSDVLLWEIVEIDGSNSVTSGTTPSNFREVVIERWRQAIIAAYTG